MNELRLDELIKRALDEDIGAGDITSEAIFAETDTAAGYLLAKQDLIVAGMPVFCRVFALLDARVAVTPLCPDGAGVRRGDRLATFSGPVRSLLAGERVALNFLQRLSGIATATRRYVEAAAGFPAVVVDTRKTTPGLRMLEKYAVTVGGGKNHRFGLDSMALIKDNHIRAAGGITAAVGRVREKASPFVRIEVEAETIAQVREALQAGVDAIMLDNMPPEMIREAVGVIGGRAKAEISGNVTLERIGALAATGADIISSGALTHSVTAADISMKFE